MKFKKDNFKNLFFLLLFVGGFFVFGVGSAEAASVYIDPTCVNNGDGTGQNCAAGVGVSGAKNTWTGISWIAGDSYLQRRGTTWNGSFLIGVSGTSGNEIIIGAYGTGDNPIIDGAAIETSYIIGTWNRNYLIIEDLSIKNNASNFCIAINRSHDLTIRNNDISDCRIGIGGLASNNFDLYNLEISGNKIHNNSDQGIWYNYGDTDSGETGKMYNLDVHNNEIYSNEKNAVKINSVNRTSGSEHYLSDFSFTYNNVYFNGIYEGGAVLAFTDIDNNMGSNLISHNVVHDNEAPAGLNLNGIWLGNVSYAVVEYNEVYNNYSGYIDGVGIFLDFGEVGFGSHNNVIRFNKTYGHTSVFNREPWGLESQFNSSGIGACCGVYDNEIYSNLSYGNAVGFSLGGSSYDNHVYNNTFIGNRIGYHYDSTGTGNTAINNIISDNILEGGGISSNWGIYGDVDAVSVGSDYNVLYNNEINVAFHTEGDNSIYNNPWLDINYAIEYNSPAIDAGTDVGLTTDYTGNPIYGTPDIGAYEYQPPYTIGSDEIDISSGARIYADGKFRDLATTSGTGADLTITPENNFESYSSTETRPAWLDITNLTWTANKKEWTESNSAANLTNTLHTVGDATPGAYYHITVDNNTENLSGENCELSEGDYICKANNEGKLTFTYTGTYSTHTFQIVPREGEIITELTDADLKINNNKETLNKDTKLYLEKNKAKLKGENPEIANGKVEIYKDNKLYKEVDIDEKGNWKKTIKFKKNHNYKIKLKLYDEFSTLRDEKEYKVRVDQEDPTFKEEDYQEKADTKSQSIPTNKNDKIVFTASDEDTDIDYYKVKVLNQEGKIIRKWRKQKDSFYLIPEDIKNEAKTIIVRVYDKAGNKGELVFDVGSHKTSPRGGTKTQSTIADNSEKLKEITETEIDTKTTQREKLDEVTTEPTTDNNFSATKTEIQPTANKKLETNPPADESKWWNPFGWF